MRDDCFVAVSPEDEVEAGVFEHVPAFFERQSSGVGLFEPGESLFLLGYLSGVFVSLRSIRREHFYERGSLALGITHKVTPELFKSLTSHAATLACPSAARRTRSAKGSVSKPPLQFRGGPPRVGGRRQSRRPEVAVVRVPRGVWLAIALATGFVGLSTMCAAIAVPFLLACYRPLDAPLLCFAAGMALFIIYTHRANIARMRAGTENRSRQLWLLRPRNAAR